MAAEAATCIALETEFGELTVKFTTATADQRDAATRVIFAVRTQLVALVDEALRPPLAGGASSPAAAATEGQATALPPSPADGGV